MPPRRPALVATLLLAACLIAPFGGAGALLAQDVPSLDDRVTDLAGVLSGDDRQAAEEAIENLDSSANVQLFTLFVDTTEDLPITDYADEVAATNGLGGNDALLVVAIDDRRDAIWVGDLLTDASDAEIDSILANEVEPRLADGEWGAAVAAAADGLGQAVDAGAAPPAEEPEPQPEPQPAEDGEFPWALVGLILLGAGAFVVWRYWGRRRAAGADAEERDRRVGGLAREANALLIEVDELIRENSQELGFAEAQFGADAAAEFHAALDGAREELRAAFAVRQRIDDATPEPPADRERLLTEIVQRCRRAQELLAEQTQRFRELRDLERHAPEVLGAQPAAIAAVRDRLPEAERVIETLRAEAHGSSEAVHGHVAEATKRLDLAEATVRDAQAALERGDRGAAARGAKAAQSAVAEAAGLVDAIEHQRAALEEARGALQDALSQARADLAAAERAGSEGATPTDPQRLREARDKLAAAEAASTGDPRDLVLAYRLAREAEAAADEVVAAERAEAERAQRERAAAEAEIRAAHITVERAADFIAARRHAIGRRPRTRLSEAQQSLERARGLQDGDPAAAVQEARRANTLANDAYRLAVNDFSDAQSAGYGGTVIVNGRHYPTGRDSGWGDDIGGAILGGIIGSILSGGGGWGGGGFGGGGFGGGGFPRGGGGFGGGRSFGGGFGRIGGGGRSRGGAW